MIKLKYNKNRNRTVTYLKDIQIGKLFLARWIENSDLVLWLRVQTGSGIFHITETNLEEVEYHKDMSMVNASLECEFYDVQYVKCTNITVENI